MPHPIAPAGTISQIEKLNTLKPVKRSTKVIKIAVTTDVINPASAIPVDLNVFCITAPKTSTRKPFILYLTNSQPTDDARSPVRYTPPMTHAQALAKTIERLPPARRAEVEQFVAFVALREQEGALVRDAANASAPAFAAVWDNEEDAVYDAL